MVRFYHFSYQDLAHTLLHDMSRIIQNKVFNLGFFHLAWYYRWLPCRPLTFNVIIHMVDLSLLSHYFFLSVPYILYPFFLLSYLFWIECFFRILFYLCWLNYSFVLMVALKFIIYTFFSINIIHFAWNMKLLQYYITPFLPSCPLHFCCHIFYFLHFIHLFISWLMLGTRSHYIAWAGLKLLIT